MEALSDSDLELIALIVGEPVAWEPGDPWPTHLDPDATWPRPNYIPADHEELEWRVVRESAGSYYGPGLHWEPRFNRGWWRISIARKARPNRWDRWLVYSAMWPVPAWVPVAEPYVLNSLAQARDKAGQLATVLRGELGEFDWRFSSGESWEASLAGAYTGLEP